MEANLLEIVQKLMDPEVIRQLPEYLQKSPIDFIDELRGSSSPISDPELSPRYIGLTTKLDVLQEEIRGLVPEDKQKVLNLESIGSKPIWI